MDALTVPVVVPRTRQWSHWRVPWWFTLLRRLGWRGALPLSIVRECEAVYPEVYCPCRMYRMSWGGQHDGSQKVEV